MAKSKIIKDIANDVVSLETSLKRALIIGNDLKNKKLVSWVKNELYGYPNNDDLPEYRNIRGYFKISYVAGYTKITNQQISSAILPDNMQDLCIYKCKDGISCIENQANAKNAPIVPCGDLIPYLKKQPNNISIFDFHLELPNTCFRKIKDCVSRELLEMLLEIDNEIGNLDDLDILASNDQIEKVNNIINFKIDSFTCIGNNNEIKDSLIAGTDVKKDGK